MPAVGAGHVSAARERGFMEVSPYAAPPSRVDDAAPGGLDLEARKAARVERLGTAIVIND
ncbi:hypothetical protein DYGSA30_45080 [Dyella sp. GSA-30]|nr:hypothetical protein DYGSA30_45080 [Dyella sp. GSA-30]